MKIAVIGATGLLGVGLVPEAASRGHMVTAICRHPEQVRVVLEDHQRFTVGY